MTNTAKKEVPNRIIGALADAFGKSYKTIVRWIELNDDRLTSDKAKQVFTSENFKWEELESATS